MEREAVPQPARAEPPAPVPHRSVAQVAKETDGRLQVAVFAQNGNLPGSDPGALDMLAERGLELFTLMGASSAQGPVAEIQGLPFAFTSHAQVHRANDGAPANTSGANAQRRASTLSIRPAGKRLPPDRDVERPIRSADDLRGVKMRCPRPDVPRTSSARSRRSR